MSQSRPPDALRRWVAVLVLVPPAVDLEAAEPPRSTGGAVALLRDVFAPPEPSTDPETGDPIPGGWGPGRSSDLPALARAVAAFYGRRPGIPGRLGCRIYLARMAGSTVAAWLDQAAELQAAVEAAAADDDWPRPDVVLALRSRSVQLEAALDQALPGVPVRWVPTALPDHLAAALSDGLAARSTP